MSDPPTLSHLSPLTDYPASTRAAALRRFQLLRPYLEEGVALTALAKEHAIPLRTMQHWLRQYRQHGLVGLCRQPRRDRSTRRLDPRVVQFIEGLALRTPPPSAAAVYRQLAAIAPQQGWSVPSYRSVCSIISGIDPGLRTLAHDGSKLYQEAFDLLYRREATRPNEIWQADHCFMDIWVLDPSGKPRRPWLTVILDDYSRAVAGYLLSFQAPSTLQTALALRQAMWRKAEAHWHVCGIPDIFYTDHGSDFISQHMEQVSADLRNVL